MNDPRPVATLEPVRFGEFLLSRNMISDEQWLCALAQHWSAIGSHRLPIGSTIVANGFLARDVVEREARAFHDDIEVVEVESRNTVPNLPTYRA